MEKHPFPTDNHLHIHIRIHKKRFMLFLGIFFIAVVSVAGYFVYSQYRASNYDSSATEDVTSQQTVLAPDIKEKLKHEDKIASPAGEFRIPILMYHYVEYVQDKNDKIRNSLNTTPYTLEQEIKTLQGAGYTFMSNNELADVMDGKTKMPQKPVLLTFDDGYRDFYTDAYPILKKYNVKATNYVISGFLDRQNHLLTSQLKEIAADGLVEIGAHTVHHLWLKGLALKTVSTEVFQSRETLEQIIHKPVLSFAYPFGAFDEQSTKIVKDAGFRTAVSTLPGIEQDQGNRFFLYRLRAGGRTGQDLITWLDQEKFSAF